MRKALILSIVLGLVAALITLPAQARVRPKKVTMYLHGNQPLGELELNDTYLSDMWHVMDTRAPTDPLPKSQIVTNYIVGPNAACSGNGLLPVWRGVMSGTVVGTLKVNVHTVATPGAEMVVSLFPDADGGCNEAMAPPVAKKLVQVAPGPAVTQVVFKNLLFEARGSLVLQLNMLESTPGQVRMLYDSAEMNSNVRFWCIPRVGRRCT